MNAREEVAVARIEAMFEDIGISYTVENLQQFEIFMSALILYDSRTSAYGQVWKQYGALSNLLSVARKTDRLMSEWWHDEMPSIHKDALDDAFDLLNYCVFFIRNARDGNMTGSEPERPKPKRTTVTNLPEFAEECRNCPHGIAQHSIRMMQRCLMPGCSCEKYSRA